MALTAGRCLLLLRSGKGVRRWHSLQEDVFYCDLEKVGGDGTHCRKMSTSIVIWKRREAMASLQEDVYFY